MSLLNNHEVIRSLADFQQHAAELMPELAATGQPLVLTVNGQDKIVVQDAAAYQKLLDLLDRLEAIEGIRAGLESMSQGKGRPAREVFEELRKEFNIPPKY